MLGFVGQFQHTLDAKGRLILPAKFRPEFERGGYLSPNSEGCLALWTPGEFARQHQERQLQIRSTSATDRQFARYWSSNSTEIDFDKQGRFAVTGKARDYAHLESEVLIVGAIDHIELWSPALFDEFVNAAEEMFKQGSN